MNTITVRAVKWAEGWELHIEGEGVTQSRTLERADEQVRHYLETLHGRSFSSASVMITPDLGDLAREVKSARDAVVAAAAAQERAARESRMVASKLREHGLSVSDAATVMGVSRGRVSQLTR